MPNAQVPAAKPFHLLPTAGDGRPQMVLRVGITGHREFKDANLKILRTTITDVLEVIASAAAATQVNPDCRAIYSSEAPKMLLVSQLAAGADRLVAEIALDKQWHLAAVMPFFEEEFKKDFPTSVDEFSALAARARADGAAVELDSERGDDEYVQSANFMLRHCDLVLAIWNGEPALGPGGTAHVLDIARKWNIPVLKIDSNDPSQVALLSRTEAVTPEKIEGIAPTIQQLVRTILWSDLQPTAVAAASRFFLQEQLSDDQGDGRNYYDRGRFRAGVRAPVARWLRGMLMNLGELSRAVPEQTPADAPAMPVSSNYLFDHFQRADDLATAYSDVHRGTFLLVSIFGALAHICGVAAIYTVGTWRNPWFVAGELAFLAALTFVFARDRRAQRRERWLDYRLLAEMLREASLLTLVGRGLSFEATLNLEADLNPRSRWVPRAYRAIVRAAGVTGARYDVAYLEQVKKYAAFGRLTDHIRYHESNTHRMHALNQRLRLFSQILFGASFVIVAIEFASIFSEAIHPFIDASYAPVFAAALPAFAYALFALRSQSEFEILSRWSARMIVQLKKHRDRLAVLTGARLTSAALGDELSAAAETMRSEVADWMGIFETKEVEPG